MAIVWEASQKYGHAFTAQSALPHNTTFYKSE